MRQGSSESDTVVDRPEGEGGYTFARKEKVVAAASGPFLVMEQRRLAGHARVTLMVAGQGLNLTKAIWALVLGAAGAFALASCTSSGGGPVVNHATVGPPPQLEDYRSRLGDYEFLLVDKGLSDREYRAIVAQYRHEGMEALSEEDKDSLFDVASVAFMAHAQTLRYSVSAWGVNPGGEEQPRGGGIVEITYLGQPPLVASMRVQGQAILWPWMGAPRLEPDAPDERLGFLELDAEGNGTLTDTTWERTGDRWTCGKIEKPLGGVSQSSQLAKLTAVSEYPSGDVMGQETLGGGEVYRLEWVGSATYWLDAETLWLRQWEYDRSGVHYRVRLEAINDPVGIERPDIDVGCAAFGRGAGLYGSPPPVEDYLTTLGAYYVWIGGWGHQEEPPSAARYRAIVDDYLRDGLEGLPTDERESLLTVAQAAFVAHTATVSYTATTASSGSEVGQGEQRAAVAEEVFWQLPPVPLIAARRVQGTAIDWPWAELPRRNPDAPDEQIGFFDLAGEESGAPALTTWQSKQGEWTCTKYVGVFDSPAAPFVVAVYPVAMSEYAFGDLLGADTIDGRPAYRFEKEDTHLRGDVLYWLDAETLWLRQWEYEHDGTSFRVRVEGVNKDIRIDPPDVDVDCIEETSD